MSIILESMKFEHRGAIMRGNKKKEYDELGKFKNLSELNRYLKSAFKINVSKIINTDDSIAYKCIMINIYTLSGTFLRVRQDKQ